MLTAVPNQAIRICGQMAPEKCAILDHYGKKVPRATRHLWGLLHRNYVARQGWLSRELRALTLNIGPANTGGYT